MNTQTPKSSSYWSWALVIAVFAAVAVTVGIFKSFAPSPPNFSYWLACVDICLMEIAVGGYAVYNFLLASKVTYSKTPFAMHVSNAFIVSWIFVAGFVIDLVFAINAGGHTSDLIFFWMVVVKWLVAGALTIMLQLTGMESLQESTQQIVTRNVRSDVQVIIDRIYDSIRDLAVAEDQRSLQYKLTDELAILRNQMRSQLSAAKVKEEENQKWSEFATRLESMTNGLETVPDSVRQESLQNIQSAVRSMVTQLNT